MLKRIIFVVLLSLKAQASQQKIDERISALPCASTVGNQALWHNPAGLGFMGGSEANVGYLYEFSSLGNRHHFLGTFATNFAEMFTLGLGVNTKASISQESRSKLGTELSGMIGGAFRIGNTSLGLSAYKSHNFLDHKTTRTLLSFGLQTRPWSFLSFGGFFQQVGSRFFSAPNITLGVSARPFKELLTISIDTRFKALGEHWQSSFQVEPIFNVKTELNGYALSIGAKIPGLKEGWSSPIFLVNFEANLAHMGLGLSTMINHNAKNFALGANIRASTAEWPAFASPFGMQVKLTINADGTLDRPHANFIQRFFSDFESPLSVLALLRRIENDRSVSGVLLELNGFSFGNARAEEWRQAILALRRSGKEVTVYLDSPSERDYFIATAANRILMNKQETLNLGGFSATMVYFAAMLKKIGIKADAIAAGTYKTAPKRYTESKPQKEEIEVLSNILTTFYQTMLKEVSLARNIDQGKLKALFDEGELNADVVKASGLVDEIIDAGEAEEWVDEGQGTFFYANYDKRKFKQVSWARPKKIAVIPITDTIVNGRSQGGLFSFFSKTTGAKDVIDEIESAVSDQDVIGIIVRIDSPGGDAEAGHKIQQALLKAQKTKPVIASMSDVAASAGYLAATGAGKILAMPNTITGSIGVYTLMFSGEKLAEKLGINQKELSPIKNPGPTMWRDLRASEKKQAQKIVDWYYQNFIQAVSIGLHMNEKEVRANANGHVWLGQEALQRKLVHELGGFINAIDALLKVANATEQEVVIDVRSSINEQFPLDASLMSYLSSGNSLPKPILQSPYAKALKAYQLGPGPKARLPFDLE